MHTCGRVCFIKCMEWERTLSNGVFSTMCLVQAHLDITPLLECGSQITSLSYSAPHLLISSLNLTLLINTDSGASTQVSS